MTRLSSALIGAALSAVLGAVATAQSDRPEVGVSPWGADDEIGRLNLMTPVSQAAILGRISGGAPKLVYVWSEARLRGSVSEASTRVWF